MEEISKKESNTSYLWDFKTKLISRSIDTSRNECLGVGFMNKKGVKIDEENFALKKYALIYVIRGKGEYIDLDGNKYPLVPGSIFQRHPNVLHSTILDPDSNWTECFIDFGVNLYNTLVGYKLIRDNEFVYHISPEKMIESECFEIMNKLEKCSESELPFITSDIISFLAKLFQRCRTVSEKNIDEIINKSSIFFSEHLTKRINVKKYCKKEGIGYENFRKAFRQQIGIPPAQYIIKRRIDMACQMLRMSKKPIYIIANDLGYSSQYEFSAQFKKVLGISPKLYRQPHKN